MIILKKIKITILIIPYFVLGINLIGCNYPNNQVANTETELVSQSITESGMNKPTHDFNKIVGKYEASQTKIMGGYKISGYYDLTINDNYTYHVLETFIDEYNNYQENAKSFDGNIKFNGSNLLEFIGGDYGESGARIFISDNDWNSDINNININFSNGRGNPLFFKKIIENRKPIFTAESILKPGEYEIRATDDEKVYFYSSPDLNFVKSSYFNTTERVNVIKFQGNFGYIEFVNSEGQVSKGWVKANDLQKTN